MAAPSRRYRLDLRERLRREPYRFSFFQALRLLSLMEGGRGRTHAVPADLRFRTSPSLAFPPSEVVSFRESEKDSSSRLEMEVSFMGLTGPSGVLPTSYTELVQERRTLHRDESLHSFLDLFSHRAISLLAEAWRKSRFCFHYESGSEDRFTRHLLDLTGMAPGPAPRSRTAPERGSVPGSLLAFFSGTLARRVPAADGLARMAAFLVGVPVRLEQFVGHWIQLPGTDQSRLGQAGMSLGQDTLLGERVWDCQSRIRLQVGPLSASRIPDFLPGGATSSLLANLMRDTLGLALTCEVALTVEPEGLQGPTLGGASRLGLDTWLLSAPPSAPRSDVRFTLQVQQPQELPAFQT